jgi:NodT family efflux transporter outer membrane factor (OMF) lipoprotein
MTRAKASPKQPVGRGHRLRRLMAAGLAGATLLNGGCLSTGPLDYFRNGFKVGPEYARPPAPVAPEWIQSKNAAVQNRHLQDWWVVFDDPTLNSLIDTAFGQNLNLRSIGTRVLQARAQQAIAVGDFFPQTQTANASYSRVGLSRNVANNVTALTPLFFNSATASSIGSVPADETPTNWFAQWSTGLNMSWELDFWGRFRRQIESANANLDASVENYDDALVTLLADVATNYVQFRVAQQRIRIARDNVRIQQGILELTQERFRVGTSTRLDVEQARTILQQTLSSIPALQITLGQANDVLCVLLGVPPHDLEPELGPGPELGSDPMPHTPDWVAAGIPADLLARRPDLRSAERQIAAQSAQIGVAEADLYPTIAINGTIGLEAQNLSKLFESSSFFGSIMPDLKWNILNYGRIVNNVRLQAVRVQQLIAAYQNRTLTAAQEVETSLRGFLRSREQADALAASVKAAADATGIGTQQYRAGTIDFNRVFNLETTQVQQQEQLAVAQGNIALNLITVYRSLGGGWELREQKAGGRNAGACATPPGPPHAPPPAALPAPPQGTPPAAPPRQPAAANVSPASVYPELAPTSLTQLVPKSVSGSH